MRSETGRENRVYMFICRCTTRQFSRDRNAARRTSAQYDNVDPGSERHSKTLRRMHQYHAYLPRMIVIGSTAHGGANTRPTDRPPSGRSISNVGQQFSTQPRVRRAHRTGLGLYAGKCRNLLRRKLLTSLAPTLHANISNAGDI
jgi:hypothetical protein